MRDWFTIQREKGKSVRLRKFIQANPVLDKTMRTLLANYLNLSEPYLQKWIQDYQDTSSECSQPFTLYVQIFEACNFRGFCGS